MRSILLLLFSSLLSLAARGAETSPYAAERTRTIKAMSDSEVAGYLAGRGQGLARAAELNRHPGPRHVLDLGVELALTPDQIAQLEEFFRRMETAAKSAGADLVAREGELDRLFAERRATPEQVLALTAEIGRLQGLVRAAHLNAHVATAGVLTPQQIARYVTLRGYDPAGAPAHDPSGHAR